MGSPVSGTSIVAPGADTASAKLMSKVDSIPGCYAPQYTVPTRSIWHAVKATGGSPLVDFAPVPLTV